METTLIGIHVLPVTFHHYDPKKHQYDKKKYIELLKLAFENILPFKFPDLEELSKSAFNQKSTQLDLISFQNPLLKFKVKLIYKS